MSFEKPKNLEVREYVNEAVERVHKEVLESIWSHEVDPMREKEGITEWLDQNELDYLNAFDEFLLEHPLDLPDLWDSSPEMVREQILEKMRFSKEARS